jgi:predicted ATP-grasp superfamily ATP-dependent carboligase
VRPGMDNVAKVLILDGHCSAALAFARSLGRAGYTVAVGHAKDSFAPARLSKFCKYFLEYPGPQREAAAFVSSVGSFARELQIDLILPMTDATVRPLSRARNRMEELRVTLPADEALELVSDKYRTIALAQDLGVPVLRTVLVQSPDEIEKLSGWSFPVVIKNRFSVRWQGDQAVSGSVAYAYSKDQLAKRVEERICKSGDILVQEFAHGVGIGFACFIHDGSIYLPFQWERLREKDPRGSGSAARKSMALDKDVARHSKALLAHAGFSGLAMVEYKLDRATGKLALMEINGRPWGSMQLPIHCGIDYPLHLARWYLNGKLPPRQIQYKQGINCRWLAAELTYLENLWAGKPDGWPVEYPSFLSELLRTCILWYPGVRYDDLSWTDPKPGLTGLARWFGAHMQVRG